MKFEQYLESLVVWCWPIPVMIYISLKYFRKSKTEADPSTSVFASLHGFFAACLFIGANIFSYVAKSPVPELAMPYALFHIVPIASIIFAIVRFSKWGTFHSIQLLNIFCITWTLFVGEMFLTGDGL